MGIGFRVLYHPKVLKEDIANLGSEIKRRIQQAIEEKLMTQPDQFGIPLRRSLKGYRKLRVGDYRVVFRLQGEDVFVLAILHRSIVYAAVSKRG